MNSALIQRLDSYVQKYGVSYNKVAAGLGYTASVLSQCRRGEYKGDNDAVEAKLTAWLDLQEARDKAGPIPFVALQRTMRIKTVVRIAHEERFIALILGRSGSGKSRALEEFAAENPATSMLIKADPTMGLSTLVTTISREIGLDSRGRISEVSDRLIQELKKRSLVVIIDEADYLTDQVWEWARIAINDKGGSALVMAGLPRIEGRIKSFKSDHRQIENRVGIMHKVDDLGQAEIREVLQAVWPALSDDGIAKLFEQSARGSLHLLVRHIALTRRGMRALQDSDLPTAEIVSDAARMLIK